MTTERVANLEAAMNRRVSVLPNRIRPFVRAYKELPRACMLTGARGVGKTTFLLYHAQLQKRRILYLSADNPTLAAESLYDIVSFMFLNGFSGVIVDEVHWLFAVDGG